jgi:hypothetical protein
MSFQENPSQLKRTIRGLGFDVEELERQGLDLVYASPVELQIDSIIVDLFRRIEEKGVRRLVLDAVGDLASAATDPQRLHDYLYALVQHLAVRTITSVLNFETTGNTIAHAGMQNAMSYLSDNVLSPVPIKKNCFCRSNLSRRKRLSPCPPKLKRTTMARFGIPNLSLASLRSNAEERVINGMLSRTGKISTSQL